MQLTKQGGILKKIFTFLLLLYCLTISNELIAQCFQLSYSNCISLNSTVTISADNGYDCFWTIVDPSSNIITPSFPINYLPNLSANILNTYNGEKIKIT